ncbi:unnamed protein product, partial [Toxocara canis]|uniref:Fes1 domain-containing protein n=1 Tax=Toxocara canis TaxID=6265 RepID=A0A183U8H3_TOXCA
MAGRCDLCSLRSLQSDDASASAGDAAVNLIDRHSLEDIVKNACSEDPDVQMAAAQWVLIFSLHLL